MKTTSTNYIERPRVPPTAYTKWVDDHRAEYLQKFPNLKIRELCIAMALDYISLGEEIKDQYHEDYRKRYKFYQEEMAKYQGTHYHYPPTKPPYVQVLWKADAKPEYEKRYKIKSYSKLDDALDEGFKKLTEEELEVYETIRKELKEKYDEDMMEHRKTHYKAKEKELQGLDAYKMFDKYYKPQIDENGIIIKSKLGELYPQDYKKSGTDEVFPADPKLFGKNADDDEDSGNIERTYRLLKMEDQQPTEEIKKVIEPLRDQVETLLCRKCESFVPILYKTNRKGLYNVKIQIKNASCIHLYIREPKSGEKPRILGFSFGESMSSPL